MTAVTPRSQSSCNLTIYREWYSKQLGRKNELIELDQIRLDLLHIDRQDTSAWKVMDFDNNHDEFVSLYSGRRPELLNISQGRAMELSSIWCDEKMSGLRLRNVGSHSPYTGINYHDAMCERYCLASDWFRIQALESSSCTCLELSTQHNEISYVKEGDWCRKNTGLLFCKYVAEKVCEEISACDLDDFSCPRREYNKVDIPLRGYGNECGGGIRGRVCVAVIVIGYTIVSMRTWM